MTDLVASAVVIPQSADTEASGKASQGGRESSENGDVPTGSKRRRSSASSQDSKRPRLSTDAGTTQARTSRGAENLGRLGTTDTSAEAGSSSARRRSLQDREKGRAKRLFGSLFSDLSQGGKQSAVIRQRAEIDRRQKEKLREQQEKADKEHSGILATRRIEQQKQWEEDGLRIRHANMRAQAHFLMTEAQPSVYWKPYTLSADQQRTIDRQLEQVEKEIERETKEFWVARGEQRLSGTMEIDSQPHTSGEASEPATALPGPVETQDAATANDPDTGNAADEGDEDHMVEAGEDSVIY